MEQRPEMDAISTELPAKIKFGPTPTEPVVEAEDLPEGKHLPMRVNESISYLQLGLRLSVRPFCDSITGCTMWKNLVVQLLYRLIYVISTSKSSTVKHKPVTGRVYSKPTMPFFVDDKSSLKNDKFGGLGKSLKNWLDKLEGSSDYNA